MNTDKILFDLFARRQRGEISAEEFSLEFMNILLYVESIFAEKRRARMLIEKEERDAA